MAADTFYDQFTPTVSFLEPCELIGTVEEREAVRGADGPFPRYKLRLDNGRAVYVNGAQARLLEELVKAAPAVGDRLKIVYAGEADRAAPGMSKAKLFTVAVRRPTPPPPDRPVGKTASGSATPTENGTGAGK